MSKMYSFEELTDSVELLEKKTTKIHIIITFGSFYISYWIQYLGVIW